MWNSNNVIGKIACVALLLGVLVGCETKPKLPEVKLVFDGSETMQSKLDTYPIAEITKAYQPYMVTAPALEEHIEKTATALGFSTRPTSAWGNCVHRPLSSQDEAAQVVVQGDYTLDSTRQFIADAGYTKNLQTPEVATQSEMALLRGQYSGAEVYSLAENPNAGYAILAWFLAYPLAPDKKPILDICVYGLPKG